MCALSSALKWLLTRVDGCVCSSQPEGARKVVEKASVASRLPTWHQKQMDAAHHNHLQRARLGESDLLPSMASFSFNSEAMA